MLYTHYISGRNITGVFMSNYKISMYFQHVVYRGLFSNLRKHYTFGILQLNTNMPHSTRNTLYTCSTLK